MTTSWRDEYLQALQERDEKEKASYDRIDDDLIAAFTTLLEKTVALEAEKAARNDTPGHPSPSPSPAPFIFRARTPAPIASEENTNDTITKQLRADLAETVRANGQLQTRVKAAETELRQLRAQRQADSKAVGDLSRERAHLVQKLKDRDEELRGKAKLLDDLHDEVVSFNLELNMSEQRVNQLKTENKDLIDRWMASKGQEAEEMNKRLHILNGK